MQAIPDVQCGWTTLRLTSAAVRCAAEAGEKLPCQLKLESLVGVAATVIVAVAVMGAMVLMPRAVAFLPVPVVPILTAWAAIPTDLRSGGDSGDLPSGCRGANASQTEQAGGGAQSDEGLAHVWFSLLSLPFADCGKPPRP